MTHATGASSNDLPEAFHTCFCGYSLKSAYGFFTQKEISRMMLNHLETVHGVEK